MRVLRNLFFISLVCMAAWRLELERVRPQPGAPSLRSALSHAAVQLPNVQAASIKESIYFSPGENLERVDVSLIDEAQSSLDIAMYAFTDRAIAQALERSAARGVKVRVYRDRGQFEEEQARGSQVGGILASQPNIQIRVKGSNDLMHEKVMLVDGGVLRDGSGNWSVSAARYQDNQVSITNNQQQIEAFARDFTAMWGRSDNLRVQ